MGSRPRSYMGTPIPMRKTPRRKPNPQRRACKIQHNSSRIRASACVSDKLEALKSLIPVHTEQGGEIKPDQLFQETAEYIVLLRTQISVLQKLVDFYGSSAGQAQPDQHAAAV